MRQQDNSERIRALRAEKARVTVELHTVEDGTLPWMESYPRCFLAKTFADAFGLTLPAAGNRLAKLVEVGLVERFRQPGRRSAYRAVNNTELDPLVLEGEVAERIGDILKRRGEAA